MERRIIATLLFSSALAQLSPDQQQQQQQPHPSRRADGPLVPKDGGGGPPGGPPGGGGGGNIPEKDYGEYEEEEELDGVERLVPHQLPQQQQQQRPLQNAKAAPNRAANQVAPSSSSSSTDCRSKTKSLPHEKYCDLYYHKTGCDDGQQLLRSCPNGLLFTVSGRHGLIGPCDYPHNVDCDGKEKHNPPIGTEHCDWLYGIFGHETSCTRYWTCWNGTATEQHCIGGLLYNEETHACDWPEKVSGCQKHPLCKDDPNGNVPLGKSCNRYWSCQGGYPRLQRCPAMLVFDKTRKRCIAPPTEDCEVPPTTNAPGEEGGEGGQGEGGGGQPGQPNKQRTEGGGGEGEEEGQQEQQQEQQQQQNPPENRRRVPSSQQQQQLRQEGEPADLPFQLPAGATLLSRPPSNN